MELEEEKSNTKRLIRRHHLCFFLSLILYFSFSLFYSLISSPMNERTPKCYQCLVYRQTKTPNERRHSMELLTLYFWCNKTCFLTIAMWCLSCAPSQTKLPCSLRTNSIFLPENRANRPIVAESRPASSSCVSRQQKRSLWTFKRAEAARMRRREVERHLVHLIRH